MTTNALALENPHGWLRGPGFDTTLIFGVTALALLSGAIVVARPHLFPYIVDGLIWKVRKKALRKALGLES